MILEMKVPSPGESITEVEIATWLVKDGDYVEKDQVIAEVDSDKATLELPAEESGTITLKAEEGDTVDVKFTSKIYYLATEKLVFLQMQCSSKLFWQFIFHLRDLLVIVVVRLRPRFLRSGRP